MATQKSNSESQNHLAYKPFLFFYSVTLSLLTFFLLFAGAMVTSTNSGLSVPDWPTTFGQNMFTFPPSMMKGGIFYEHGHRLFASMVGFLTIGICLFFWIVEKRRWLQWTGTAALLMVILQGTLGGMTVRYKLPMPVSTAHACVAELFFLVTILMAFATSRTWIDSGLKSVKNNEKPSIATLPQIGLAVIFCGLIFFQILIGAIMRHSYAGLSIPTFPLAYGQILPPFWSFEITVNFLHTRLGPLVLTVVALLLIPKVLRSKFQTALSKKLAVFLTVAISIQVLLGMFAIWSQKAPVPTSFHLSGGALVFGTSFLLILSIFKLSAKEEKKNWTSPNPQGSAHGLTPTESNAKL